MSIEGRLVLALPFRGPWKVQNSPADRVPSHGTELFALAHSIDLVPVDGRGRTAPFRLGNLVRHLRRGSIVVRPGQEIRVGDLLGACGNSGNSTEPHLHLQAMSAADPSAARAVPFDLPGGLPRGGQVVDAG